MTLCPIAVAVGCRKCPIFAVCPAKGIIGDYKADEGKGEAKSGKKTSGAKPSK